MRNSKVIDWKTGRVGDEFSIRTIAPFLCFLAGWLILDNLPMVQGYIHEFGHWTLATFTGGHAEILNYHETHIVAGWLNYPLILAGGVCSEVLFFYILTSPKVTGNLPLVRAFFYGSLGHVLSVIHISGSSDFHHSPLSGWIAAAFVLFLVYKRINGIVNRKNKRNK